jgi:phosphoribosylformylglycinamidine cyclo-ligase
LIQKKGNVETGEMFHTFNMGIGMTIITSPENADVVVKAVSDAKLIGEINKQTSDARVMIDGVGYHRDKIL